MKAGTGANYAEIESDGTLVFEGDATVWDDLRVPLNTAKIAGANVPSYSAIAGGNLYGWFFQDGDEIFFNAQVPHSYKLGTNLHAHVHWSPVTDVSPADNVGFGLEYALADIGDDLPFGATADTGTIDCSTGINAQYQHIYSGISTGVGPFSDVSGMLVCRLYRAAASADNYAGDVIVHEFDFHFQIDTVGSRTELVK